MNKDYKGKKPQRILQFYSQQTRNFLEWQYTKSATDIKEIKVL